MSTVLYFFINKYSIQCWMFWSTTFFVTLIRFSEFILLYQVVFYIRKKLLFFNPKSGRLYFSPPLHCDQQTWQKNQKTLKIHVVSNLVVSFFWIDIFSKNLFLLKGLFFYDLLTQIILWCPQKPRNQHSKQERFSRVSKISYKK